MTNTFPYEKDNLVRQPWEHYFAKYQEADPQEIASRLSLPYDPEKKEFSLCFLGTQYQVSFPDFQVTHTSDPLAYYPLEEMIKARILTLRFLLNGNDSPGSGAFRTYREMPWGEVYLRQFDGRCIKRLAFSYGNRLETFQRVMEHAGAVRTAAGDLSYRLAIYPGYEVQMILWEGDEEFPPSSQFLFSDNFPLSFEAEDIAQMGDVLISTLKAWEKLL
ncbi:MAG: DUF3786 domain-containing protein [Blautia sp.]|nr:DUF3786 domain-containing protein [Blautia sp.]